MAEVQIHGVKLVVSVVNRQHYVKVLHVLTNLACKRLALQYQVEKKTIMPNVLVVAIEDLLYLKLST